MFSYSTLQGIILMLTDNTQHSFGSICNEWIDIMVYGLSYINQYRVILICELQTINTSGVILCQVFSAGSGQRSSNVWGCMRLRHKCNSYHAVDCDTNPCHKGGPSLTHSWVGVGILTQSSRIRAEQLFNQICPQLKKICSNLLCKI